MLFDSRRTVWLTASLAATTLLGAEATFFGVPYKPLALAALQSQYLEALKFGLLSLGGTACVVLFLVIGLRASRVWRVVLWAAFTLVLFTNTATRRLSDASHLLTISISPFT